MLRHLFSRLGQRLVDAAAGGTTTTRTVRGLPVVVHNTRADIDTEQVLARLDEALALIERYQPWHFRRFRRDFAAIWVRRWPCRGAFLPEQRVCLVELTFLVNPEFAPVQIAATIVHEGMHARLHACGVQHTVENAARHERFCRRAEIELGRMVPGGEVVVARALASLELPDEDVAPAIDWSLAQRRMDEVDRGAGGPRTPSE